MNLNKNHKNAKLFFAIALTCIIATFVSVSVSAQDRHDRDKNRKEQNHHPSPQPQRFNRAPANPPQAINRAPQNRPTVHRAYNEPGYRPQGWSAGRRPYRRPPIVYNGRRYYTYHPYKPHLYIGFSYGPLWHPIGFFVSRLLTTAIIIDFENRAYHYDAGVFYAPYNGGYRVIPAPPGAYVPTIPQGYQQVAVGGQTYYYFGGAFFIYDGTNYEVVAPPAGAVVYNLPVGATSVQIDNYEYMEYNDTYYQPIQINGQDAYEVVEMEPDTQPQP
jgi:Family of unknown function (DUF6515)